MAGGGVGEAMLIGAVTGAGTSAVTGGDPLKGALLGAAGGGATAGIGGMLGGGSGAASGTASGAASGTASGATSSAIPGSFQAAIPEVTGTANALSGPSTAVPGSFKAAVPSLTSGTTTAATYPGFENLPSTGDLLARRDEIQTGGSALANLIKSNPNLAPAAGGFLATTIGSAQGIEDPRKKYRGPLSRFSYNPDSYVPAFASGGIADLPVSKQYANGGHLGSYSDGGRLLKGPGDGMSDSIPAKIGQKQPARLADGEFVVPADVVSGLGNGSTDAGAKHLYAMMDKVRQARTGNKKQGKQINPRKYLPT